MYFRNLVLSAFAIAIVAGFVFSAYQAFFITPLILTSELYEVSEPLASHQIEAWAPADGMERNSWSLATNFLLCFAYALILMSVMTVSSSISFVKGLFWGGAAYLTVFAAPALGLPPEIPGMEEAYLEGRQAWWILTVILTALALWLIAFQSTLNKVIGLILILVPHIVGAPQAEIHGFINSDPKAVEALTLLWHDFILQTSIANALLWLVIGGLSAYSIKRFINPIDALDEKKM